MFGSLFSNAEEFLIGIKDGTPVCSLMFNSPLENKSVVSIASTRALADEHWKWINDELLSTLSKDPRDHKDMIQFLETKFNDLPSSSVRGKQVQAALSEQAQFRKRFNLPNENLVSSMSCLRIFIRLNYLAFLGSYWKVFYCAGTIYLGHTSICFTSPLTDDLVLAFLLIKAIEREGSFGLIIKTEKKRGTYPSLETLVLNI